MKGGYCAGAGRRRLCCPFIVDAGVESAQPKRFPQRGVMRPCLDFETVGVAPPGQEIREGVGDGRQVRRRFDVGIAFPIPFSARKREVRSDRSPEKAPHLAPISRVRLRRRAGLAVVR